MRYEIVATLGPATAAAADWAALLAAGATAFRLNTSHLSLDDLDQWLERLAAFCKGRGAPASLVLDLQGSKWRLGQFPAAELRSGQELRLEPGETSRAPGVLPVPHPDFFLAAPHSSDMIVLNDARVRLRVEAIEGEAGAPAAIRARVVQGGPVAPRKGITYSQSDYRSEALSAKDQAILERCAGLDFVRYAISYVRDGVEMARYREWFRRSLGREPSLIAKLERGPAVADAARIAEHAGELWLCRGDLGAELGLSGMAAAAARFAREAPRLPAPAFLAGQVFEHMTASPTPTRSEVCCLYDSLQAGYRGVVLSDETAVGRYPLEACREAARFIDDETLPA